MPAAVSHRYVLALGSVAAALALFAATATPALAQSEGGSPPEQAPPPLERLWSEYPLNPARPDVGASQRTPPSREDAGTPPVGARTEDGDSTEWIPLLLAAAGAILVVLAVSIVRSRLVPATLHLYVDSRRPQLPRLNRDWHRLLSRRYQGGLPMDKFVRRLLPTREDGDAPREASEAEQRSIDPAIFTPYGVQPRSDAVSAQHDQSIQSPEPKSDATVDEAHAYAHVGERVTAVLTSAQAAAEEILSSARADAERILAEAAARADDMVAGATRQAQVMRRDAESARAETMAYGEKTRSSADRYAEEGRKRADAAAAEKVAEAEERAQAIRAEAQRRARHVETEAARRHAALLREVERTEGRVQDLVKVFRGMTKELETLVPAEAGEETLENALKPQPAAASPADSDAAARTRG